MHAYKDKFRIRDRKEDNARLAQRNKQQCWTAEITEIVSSGNVTTLLGELPWPACNWEADMEMLVQLSEWLQGCPPNGEVAWCHAVEAKAASLFLLDGQFWDDVEASGYRLLTSLQSAPAELRNLPLGDRLYIRSVNERIGICKEAREVAGGQSSGGMRFAVSRLAQLGYDQYLSQREHPVGIQDFNDYMNQVGFSMYLPVGGALGELADDSELRLAPSHPGLQTRVRVAPVPSLTRARTQLADLSHMLKPNRRAWVENTSIPELTQPLQRTLAPCTKADVFVSGIIPFGDLYRSQNGGHHEGSVGDGEMRAPFGHAPQPSWPRLSGGLPPLLS